MDSDNPHQVEALPTLRPLGALLHDYWTLAEALPGKPADELISAAEAAAAQDQAA